MVEVKKESTKTEMFLDAWETRQNLMSEEHEALTGISYEIKRVSKRYGRKAIMQKARKIIESERSDLAALMEVHLGRKESEKIVEKGLGLLKSGGYDPKRTLTIKEVLSGEAADNAKLFRLMIAMGSVLRRDDLTEQDRKLVTLMCLEKSSDIMTQACHRELIAEKLSSLTRPDFHLMKRLNDEREIKHLLKLKMSV
jgi:hypothetical protein